MPASGFTNQLSTTVLAQRGFYFVGLLFLAKLLLRFESIQGLNLFTHSEWLRTQSHGEQWELPSKQWDDTQRG